MHAWLMGESKWADSPTHSVSVDVSGCRLSVLVLAGVPCPACDSWDRLQANRDSGLD